MSNSFAVPFDEDEKDPDVYFLDHDYLETMYNMFKKVTIRGMVQSDPDLTAPDLTAPRFNGRINFPQKNFGKFPNFLISHVM